MTYTQVKEMVNLNLFIEHHYKYIVSIIKVKLILTLHLSTANWRILTTTGCCCKNVAAHYCTCYTIYFCLVESIPQFLELWPVFTAFNGTLILLYFIEMLPRTVSNISWHHCHGDRKQAVIYGVHKQFLTASSLCKLETVFHLLELFKVFCYICIHVW